MSKLGFILLAAMLLGSFCLLLALGHVVMNFLCMVCRPFEEWRERGIELLEMQEDEE